ncbi:GntR family transcriptional regulator [soil metagenome]
MSPEPVTAERTYQRLKLDILFGRFQPGQLVVSQMIAEEFGTSISPVRDAMQRLVGERLIGHREGGGFEVPPLTAHGLRNLYIWHGQVVRLAAKQRDNAALDSNLRTRIEALDPDDSFGIVHRTVDLFRDIGNASRNIEHGLAIGAIGDRLFAARLKEHGLRDRKQELIAVWDAIISGPDPTVRDVLWAYHRRRIRRADALVRVFYTR